MNNYVVTSVDPGKNIGGGKAKEDIIKYLGEIGYQSFPLQTYRSKLKKLIYGKLTLPAQLNKQALGTVILQYPVSSRYALTSLLGTLARKPAKNFVIWIHDIQNLQSENEADIQKEIEIFNQADELIVHNAKMKQWLKAHGCERKMVELEIFDYDNPQPFQERMQYDKSVCFAGNLFKSEFLKKLDITSQLAVYGPNMFAEAPACIHYKGQYSPEELPKYLTQNFGLIWDGPSVEKCSGMFGRYLLYNNPHKTSLYISSGLPIIIWDQAAMADFVVDNNLGVKISSLNELDGLLAQISVDEYQKMRANTIEMGKKLRAGHFTKAVVAKLADQ